MYCYKGTNITGERAVNPHKTQLNDALIAPYRAYGLGYVLTHPVTEKKGEYAGKGEQHQKIVSGTLSWADEGG